MHTFILSKPMRRGPGKDGVSRYFGMLYGRPAAVSKPAL